jgi:hypothetical protein
MATFAQAATDFDRIADAIDHGVNAADKLFGGQFIRSRILERTSRGVDAEGSTFTEYSPGYAKQREKHGSRTDQVDLYGFEHHPHMLNAMMVEQTTTGFQVGFWGEEAERARWNNEGTDRAPVRGFFHATAEDVSDVQSAMGQRMEVRLKNASLGNLAAALKD